MKKLTRKQFIEKATEGPIKINDNLNYLAVKMNSSEIEMSEQFKRQLINESLYNNSFVGILINDNEKVPFSMEKLPIYGRSDKFETKHLKRSFEDAIMTDLRGRELKLLDRELEARVYNIE